MKLGQSSCSYTFRKVFRLHKMRCDVGIAGSLITGVLLLYSDQSSKFTGPTTSALLRDSFESYWSGGKVPTTAFQTLLLRQPTSPYRWADLAENLFKQGNIASARYCISRAVASGANVPATLLRAMNMSWVLGDTDKAIAYSRRILSLTALYDAVIFSTYARMGLTMEQVLEGWSASEVRGLHSYFRYAVQHRGADELGKMWTWMSQRDLIENPLASIYLDRLLTERRYREAFNNWIPYARRYETSYPDKNAIFNGGFELPISGIPFDWRITPTTGVDVRQSAGKGQSGSALEVSFNDGSPPGYSNVSQLVPVSGAATYTFLASMRSQSPRCGGIGFRIFDVEAPHKFLFNTRQVTGEASETIEASFALPEHTRLLRVQVIRNANLCVEPGSTAKAWIDDVRLIPR